MDEVYNDCLDIFTRIQTQQVIKASRAAAPNQVSLPTHIPVNHAHYFINMVMILHQRVKDFIQLIFVPASLIAIFQAA